MRHPVLSCNVNDDIIASITNLKIAILPFHFIAMQCCLRLNVSVGTKVGVSKDDASTYVW